MINLGQKLKQAGRKALVVGGLGASSLWLCGNTGCQTMNTNAMNSPIVQGLGWDMVHTYAQESIRARVNPNQTNVYNENGGNQGGQEQDTSNNPFLVPVPNSFICRGYQDKNGDGMIGKGELEGLGNYIQCKKLGEETNFVIGSLWYNVKGQNEITKIRANKTEEIGFVNEYIFTKKDEIRMNHMRHTKNPRSFGVQEFSVEFYINGRLDPTKTINYFVDFGKKEEDRREPELIIFNEMRDLNGDGLFTDEEIFGVGKKVFDLSKEQMGVLIRGDCSGKITFRSSTKEGKLIGETINYYNIEDEKKIFCVTGPDGPSQGDFMDNIKGAGPGHYVITATFDDGRTFREEVVIK